MHPPSRPSARAPRCIASVAPSSESRSRAVVVTREIAGLKKRAETADMRSMDVLGASMLAARIRAGVRIGQMIELLGDSSTSPDLKRGDIGLVAGFSANGNILVRLERRQRVEELDPATDSYQAIVPRLADSA